MMRPTGQILTQKNGATVFDLYTSAEQLDHAHLHMCAQAQVGNARNTSRIVLRPLARKQHTNRAALSGAQTTDANN